jgi:hypothetical protein
VHDNGWGATTSVKFFVPMWAGTKIGALRSSSADNIQFNLNYCKGANEPCGLGGTAGSLYAGDAYWTGGLQLEYMDLRTINNGLGSFYNDKASVVVFNAQYHSILTDCTDPIHCLALTLAYNYTATTPGSITQNVDWTEGGLGKANVSIATAELSWGTSRNGSTRPVWWRLDSEVQWRRVNQTLPCDNNGNTSTGVCLTPTAIPLGISQNPSNWVYRATITFDY